MLYNIKTIKMLVFNQIYPTFLLLISSVECDNEDLKVFCKRSNIDSVFIAYFKNRQ